MKLVRLGPPGSERPGLVDAAGQIRELAEHVDQADVLAPATLARLARLDPAGLPLAPPDARLGPCVGGTRNFIAIGLNYVDHALEAKLPMPTEPIVFNKAPSSIGGAYDDVAVPNGALRMDWEVELAIVIGSPAYRVAEAAAAAAIAGYCVCNDLSERDWQFERAGQWAKGKSAPGFGPLGPWLVTADEIGNVLDLAIFLEVDGRRMQDGSTRDMIFAPAYLVSYVSRFMRLEAGDVITTGTPAGVGMASGTFLRPGNRIRCGIAGLGEQTFRLVADDGGAT